MAEATLTMRPPPCARMRGVTARAQFHTPLTLTAMTRSHSASGISSKGWGLSAAKMAALLTSTSMRPKRATAASTMVATEADTLTSVDTPSTRSAAPSLSAAATGSTTSATTTRAPSARNRFAYCRPMPAAPPLITATLPWSLIAEWPGRLSGEQIGDAQARARGGKWADQGAGRQHPNRPAVPPASRRALRIAPDLDRLAGEIDDPVVGNAGPGVETPLGDSIPDERGTGDLDHEHGRGGMRVEVVLDAPANHGDVGLRLGDIVQGDRE